MSALFLWRRGSFTRKGGAMPVYRRVDNRCALDLARVGGDRRATIQVLKDLGCQVSLFPSVVGFARAVVSAVPTYQRGADIKQAPTVFDCSSLTKWIFGQIGLGLAQYAIDQRDFLRDSGWISLPQERLQEGQIVFSTGRNDHYETVEDGVGHCGIVTGEGTIIHAAGRRRGIVEDDEDHFFGRRKQFRGAFRAPGGLVIVTIPDQLAGKRVKTSDDLVRKIRAYKHSHG